MKMGFVTIDIWNRVKLSTSQIEAVIALRIHALIRRKDFA